MKYTYADWGPIAKFEQNHDSTVAIRKEAATTMKRIIAVTLLAAMGGAAISFLVSVVIALSSNPFANESQRTTGFTATAAGTWEVVRWQRTGTLVVHSYRTSVGLPEAPIQHGVPPAQLVPAWADLPDSVEGGGGTLHDYRAVEARGWPCLAFGCMVRFDLPSLPAVESQGGLPTGLAPWEGRGPRMPRMIPLRPRWPGLLVNSLVFGGLLGLLYIAVRIESTLTTRSCGSSMTSSGG